MAKEDTVGQTPQNPDAQEIANKLLAKFAYVRSQRQEVGQETSGQPPNFIATEENPMIIEEVKPDQIVSTVMSSVGDARGQVQMSMLLAEELHAPLPPAYHQLLQQKLTEGVKITRIGFGSKEDHDAISQRLGLDSENFTFLHNPDTEQYQRFILIDDTMAFFNVEGKYYKSYDQRSVQFFQKYAELAGSTR